MNFCIILSVLIIIVKVCTVSTEKSQYISDCFIKNQDLIFICGDKNRNSYFFSEKDSFNCKNDFYLLKSLKEKISFENCDQPIIPSNLPQVYLDLRTMNAMRLGLTSLEQIPFTEAKQLTTLIASHNAISEIPSFSFHKTHKVVEIDLAFNKIRVNDIDDFAFAGDFKLKKLNLSYNHLDMFDGKILESQTHLTHLDISGNPIKKLDNEMFARLTNLEFLNISCASLSEIGSETFAKLSNLQILDLSNNDIKVLPSNVFPSQMNQLNLLSIGNNQLQEIQSVSKARMPNAKILGVDSNRLNCTSLHEFFETIDWSQLDSISNRIKCDKTQDIKDNIQTTTEPTPYDVSPSTNAAVTCKVDEFRCRSSYQCISSSWVCNNERDCSDNSDEDNCSNDPNTFVCNNGRYIRLEWKCDGVDGCGDSSDEINCEHVTTDSTNVTTETSDVTTVPTDVTTGSSDDLMGTIPMENRSDDGNKTLASHDQMGEIKHLIVESTKEIEEKIVQSQHAVEKEIRDLSNKMDHETNVLETNVRNLKEKETNELTNAKSQFVVSIQSIDNLENGIIQRISRNLNLTSN